MNIKRRKLCFRLFSVLYWYVFVKSVRYDYIVRVKLILNALSVGGDAEHRRHGGSHHQQHQQDDTKGSSRPSRIRALLLLFLDSGRKFLGIDPSFRLFPFKAALLFLESALFLFFSFGGLAFLRLALTSFRGKDLFVQNAQLLTSLLIIGMRLNNFREKCVGLIPFLAGNAMLCLLQLASALSLRGSILNKLLQNGFLFRRTHLFCYFSCVSK